MDSTIRPTLGRKSLTLQERVQALRQKKSFPVEIPNNPKMTKEPESGRRIARGCEPGQIPSEPTTAKLKRKHSPVAETINSTPSCSSKKKSDAVPVRKPECSPRLIARAVSSRGPPVRSPKPKPGPVPMRGLSELTPKPKAVTATVKGAPEFTPRQKGVAATMRGPSELTPRQRGCPVGSTPERTPRRKADAVPVRSPTKISPRLKTDTLRSPLERKSKTPISDRVNKYRAKLSTEASNKTHTLETGAKRALNIPPGPSKLRTQTSVKKDFKIPKVTQKPIEKLNETPAVEKNLTQDNYTEIAMDIDSAACSYTSENSNTVENMDWEISEVRRELRDPLFTNESKNCGDSLKNLTVDGQWIIAIDTNVFISDLLFVQALRDTDVAGLGFPVIYIPHRVLSELDALKDRQQLKSESVARSARKAVTYLNACLMEKHPRIKGQSISDYIALKDLTEMSADDKILLSCLQLKKTQPNKLLVFISNDTNLRNKALIEDIETFSVEKFQEYFLSGQDIDDPAKITKTRLESRLMNTMKIVLTEILQTELKTKFRTMNNLEDVLDIFIQKWGSYFNSTLPVPAEEQLQKMRTLLQQAEKGIQLSLVTFLDIAKMFITHFYVKGKKYFNSVEKALKVFSNLRPLALDFDNGSTEEKHVTGALEAVLRLAWDKMYLESDAINKAKEARDPSYELREQHFLHSLNQLIEVLGKLMATSLFDISSSPVVIDLAVILASLIDDNQERIFNLLVNVCTTIEGRNMIANAFKIFQAAYNNCNAENHT